MAKQYAFLCAGGTGGHLFPAEALAHVLLDRGWQVDLVTDERAAQYSGTFPASEVLEVPSATISGKSPIASLKAGLTLAKGYGKARRLIQRRKPSIVVGFGGYPTVPPVLAACHLKVPTMLHDQNAVMGRANLFLAPKVKHIALGFPPISGKVSFDEKSTLIGNPVRPGIIEAAQTPYQTPEADEAFELLVFGGSQGARFFSEILPEAVDLLPSSAAKRLRIVQQARPEDQDALKARYEAMGIEAEVAPFFNRMALRLAKAHMVISRSGASTVSELAVIGRPSILVPYPHALDHDQAANAEALRGAGAAEIINQSDLSAPVLAQKLVKALENPDQLADRAAAAKSVGKPNSAMAMADLIAGIAQKG